MKKILKLNNTGICGFLKNHDFRWFRLFAPRYSDIVKNHDFSRKWHKNAKNIKNLFFPKVFKKFLKTFGKNRFWIFPHFIEFSWKIMIFVGFGCSELHYSDKVKKSWFSRKSHENAKNIKNLFFQKFSKTFWKLLAKTDFWCFYILWCFPEKIIIFIPCQNMTFWCHFWGYAKAQPSRKSRKLKIWKNPA